MEVGRLSAPVTEFLEHKGYEDPAAHGVTITRERLHHIDSGHPTPGRGRRRPKPPVTPADMDRLPAGIARPRAVLWDTQGPEGGNLIYAYDSVEPNRDVVKVPVQPNQKEKRPASFHGPRPVVITHSVRTAGYVQRHNLLRESRYQLIEGSLEDAADDEPVVVGRLRPGRWESGGRGQQAAGMGRHPQCSSRNRPKAGTPSTGTAVWLAPITRPTRRPWRESTAVQGESGSRLRPGASRPSPACYGSTCQEMFTIVSITMGLGEVGKSRRRPEAKPWRRSWT